MPLFQNEETYQQTQGLQLTDIMRKGKSIVSSPLFLEKEAKLSRKQNRRFKMRFILKRSGGFNE